MDENDFTQWEPVPEEEAEDKTEKKDTKGGRKPKEAKEEKEEPAVSSKDKAKSAAAKPPERKNVWVCKECGMSWPRPRHSCNLCGGPTGRFHGTPEELAQYASRIQTRRRRGIINS